MTHPRRSAVLALEDGNVFVGKSFGRIGETSGEVVFNTALCGYQEVLTDPSYRGQIVTMTYPHIGNYGINLEDVESSRPQVAGFVVREISTATSSWRASGELNGYLEGEGIVGISEIDTRRLTRVLRSRGACRGVVSALDLDPGSLIAKARAASGKKTRLDVTIGTMVETPRAAIRADEIAEEADFFSFGTNDLTQMTFGFSRDDVEGRMMSEYLAHGLLKRNPFETIDPGGVGELVKMGSERGRATKPQLKLGVCGEHGGDPESIALFYDAGLDYVSCSPFRVPIARLAAAQAVLGAAGGPGGTA